MNSTGVSLFATTWQAYNSALVQGLNQVISNLLSAMAVELTGALGLFIVVCGAMMVVGRLEWNTGLFNMVRALIVAALLKGSTYNTYVVTTFMTTIPNWIARAVRTGMGPAASPQQFDQLYSAVERMSAAMLQQATGLLHIGDRAVIHCATAAAEIFLLMSFAIYLLTYTVTGLVVAAGVPLVVSFLFNFTRHWGEKWLAKLVSLAVLMLFISILLQVELTVLFAYMRQVQNSGGSLDEQISSLWHVVVVFALGSIVTLSLPVLASAIGGSSVMNMSTIIIAPIRMGANSLSGLRGVSPTAIGSKLGKAMGGKG